MTDFSPSASDTTEIQSAANAPADPVYVLTVKEGVKLKQGAEDWLATLNLLLCTCGVNPDTARAIAGNDFVLALNGKLSGSVYQCLSDYYRIPLQESDHNLFDYRDDFRYAIKLERLGVKPLDVYVEYSDNSWRDLVRPHAADLVKDCSDHMHFCNFAELCICAVIKKKAMEQEGLGITKSAEELAKSAEQWFNEKQGLASQRACARNIQMKYFANAARAFQCIGKIDCLYFANEAAQPHILESFKELKSVKSIDSATRLNPKFLGNEFIRTCRNGTGIPNRNNILVANHHHIDR